MYCVKSTQTIEDTIKKSRFIGIVIPCINEQDVVRHLNDLHHEYPDATHIAYAFRIKTDHGVVYRFHDAGEPAGTAGRPIFLHLEGKDLVNLLVAVIRYFGGVKLGAGGLARAYGNTAKRVIEASETTAYVEWVNVPLTLAYDQIQSLEHTLKKLGGRITNQAFTEQVRVEVELPSEQRQNLLKAFPAGH